MDTDLRSDDPFREKIMEMLAGSHSCTGGDFKSQVFAEVQNYSREIQEIEQASDLFFRLCELIVDCQSLSVPEDSFKIIVACLLCHPEDALNCPIEEVRELIGTNVPSFEAAQDHLKNRQCIVSALNKEKTGRKGTIMAGKRNFSRSEKSDGAE
ncbi:MAG: hypothetical protein P4L43_06780 [Syntrophobacteraceae bacterium]|nr:hypothetical protein [Syntrophobacteraceae bacterium]